MNVVSNVEIMGLASSVKASRYPMATDTENCSAEVTERTMALANCQTGSGHDQFLTGIVVQFDLTFTVKTWVEAERYHFLDFVSSQSTMHRITSMDIDEQCIDYVRRETIKLVEKLVAEYKEAPTPERYLAVLYNVPVGLRLTARMTTNYRQLKTIYQQRKNHRLPEWRAFCAWIETLPRAEFITGKRLTQMAERGMARRQYQQAYYQSRKEELQERHREYYWAHREQVLAKNRENREKYQEYRRKYYLANREKIRKAQEYRRKHYHKPNTERMEKGAESNDAN